MQALSSVDAPRVLLLVMRGATERTFAWQMTHQGSQVGPQFASILFFRVKSAVSRCCFVFTFHFSNSIMAQAKWITLMCFIHPWPQVYSSSLSHLFSDVSWVKSIEIIILWLQCLLKVKITLTTIAFSNIQIRVSAWLGLSSWSLRG